MNRFRCREGWVEKNGSPANPEKSGGERRVWDFDSIRHTITPGWSANRKLDAITSILKPTDCVRIGESASGYALPELLPISRAGLSAVDCSKCFSQLRSNLLRFR